MTIQIKGKNEVVKGKGYLRKFCFSQLNTDISITARTHIANCIMIGLDDTPLSALEQENKKAVDGLRSITIKTCGWRP